MILKIEDVLGRRDLKEMIINEIRRGSIFIYPTDTVYGIGCNALKRESVLRIRRIKNTKHPFSIVAPSREWIVDNLCVEDGGVLDKLRGPFTYIFYYKKKILPREVSYSDKLGVRIPNHPFTGLIEKANVPFVTTSANISGEKPIETPKDVAGKLKTADFFVDGGRLGGRASTVVDYTQNPPRILRK